MWRAILLTLMTLTLAACEPPAKPDPQAPATTLTAPEAKKQLRHRGDLPAIRKRGVLRLLALQLEQEAGLPREGMPQAEYRRVAEAFARSLDLAPQWVLAQGTAELMPALLEGTGDVIASNLTRTDSRAAEMAFSVPLAVVDEVLVLPGEMRGKPLKALPPMQVAVPEGTAWVETLNNWLPQQSDWSIQLLPSNVQAAELVLGVAEGRYQATLLDSDLATPLLAMIDGAVAGPTLVSDRSIGWAVRPDNSTLSKALNEYLISHRVVASRRAQQQRDWQAIKKAGVLRVITSNNPASYFIWRGDLMGFDYDLMQKFANRHGLRISIVVRDGPAEMYQALQGGFGDLIAASVTRTPQREAAGWQFSRHYMKVTEQFAGGRRSDAVESLAQLAGRTVAVNPAHSYYHTLQALIADGIKLKLIERPDMTSEMLLNAVANGDYDLTLVDSHLLAMESTFRNDLRLVFDLGEEKDIGWVVRDKQTQLLDKLNRFSRKEYRGLFYNVTWNKYFAEPKFIGRYAAQRLAPGEAVSPYDDLVRELAAERPLDWRLLVAQMYQESRFDPQAESHAGALGLMQVLPRTAAQFGYQDLRDPEKNIAASLAFMDWLVERFPARLPLEERIYFTLAAYNAGHGHVQDARTLARRLGKDPDQWFGHVEQAMLLLSRPEYHRRARYGYVRGAEPVAYVRTIRERYVGYLDAGVGQ